MLNILQKDQTIQIFYQNLLDKNNPTVSQQETESGAIHFNYQESIKRMVPLNSMSPEGSQLKRFHT